jgi:hypothetical protein
MAIIRKDKLQKPLRELDLYYNNLRAAVLGEPPSANLSHAYNCEPAQFDGDFTDVDTDAVLDAVEHFKIAVAALKRLEKLKAEPNHRA